MKEAILLLYSVILSSVKNMEADAGRAIWDHACHIMHCKNHYFIRHV